MKNIYLIGYRCTGKTAVGKQLAKKLNKAFVDTDRIIEDESGMRISEIVARSGWEEFRKRESKALEETSRKSGMVVSTGGGIILDPENIETLRTTGTVIWLTASPETITTRMQQDNETVDLRPALTDKSFSDEIRETMKERYPLYNKAHHVRIDTDAADLDAVCTEIIEKTRCPDAG